MDRRTIPSAFADRGRRPRVAVVRGVCQGSFFARYLQGLRSMGLELGIEVEAFDGELATLGSRFESALASGVQAIVVSSADFAALGAQIGAAHAAGVPVVGFDMVGENPEVPSLEQDDLLIGFMLGKKLAGDCDGQADIICVNPADYAPLLKRDRTWRDFTWRYPGLREVARIGAVTENTAADTEAALAELLPAHPEASVIVAFWDEFSRGALRAIERAGLSDRVKLYSVDLTDEDLELMVRPDSPWVATVATDASNIGRVALRAAAARIAGERLSRYLLVEPQLVTQEFLRAERIGSVDELVGALPTLGESRLVWFDWMEALLARTGHRRPIATFAPERLISQSKELREANAALQSEIAERARAEAELRFANLVLRTQQETSPDGILVVGADGGILSFNRRFLELWGIPEDVVEKRSDELLLTWVSGRVADAETFLQRVRETYADRVRQFDDEVELRDGSVLERHSAPMLDEQGGYGGRVWYFRDVTERKRAEAALLDADRRKDEFLAVLSHELRNPLAPIRNSIYLLERAGTRSALGEKAVAVIDRQVTHLTRLVDDLLDVTRIARGKIRLQRELLELGELVRRTVEDHRASFTAAGVELEARLGPRPLWISGDPTRLAQIVGNLLGNAVKFTPRGGRVEVGLEPEDETAVLRVRDTGVGVDPAVAGRLFQPFAQAAQALDRTRGGLGLGLSLVKGLAELHGGSVGVASEGPGRGAEFTVRLPLAPAPALSAGPESRADGKSRRVLVIEDNVDAADSLQRLLEVLGHEVRVAYDGTQGIAEARRFEPEVVLCDIGLPGLDGYDVARVLRADPKLQGATLVALTGYALPEDQRRALEAGFVRHVAKPPRIEILEEILAGS